MGNEDVGEGEGARPGTSTAGGSASDSAQYFDAVAADYAAGYAAPTAAGHAFRERRRRLLDLLPDDPGRVLDLGSGPAILAADVTRRGGDYWGVDAAVNALIAGDRSTGAIPDVHLVAADGAMLPFPDDAFDTVICLGVIDRVTSRSSFLEEIGRVTRPGGDVLVSFPNALSPYAQWRSWVFLPAVRWVKRLLRSRGPTGDAPTLLSPVHLPTPHQARQQVDRHVGPTVSTTYLYFNPLLSPLDEWFPRVALWLSERLEFLTDTSLRAVGAAYIVHARGRAATPRRRAAGRTTP